MSSHSTTDVQGDHGPGSSACGAGWHLLSPDGKCVSFATPVLDEPRQIAVMSLPSAGRSSAGHPITTANQNLLGGGLFGQMEEIRCESSPVPAPGEPHKISRRPGHHTAEVLNIIAWFDQKWLEVFE